MQVAVSINLNSAAKRDASSTQQGYCSEARTGARPPLAAMTWITRARLLADRIGESPAKKPVQVDVDAPALFHWCNVNPAEEPPLAPSP
jgi:hypothetical protein